MTQIYIGQNRETFDSAPTKVTVTSGSSGSTDIEVRVDTSKNLTKNDMKRALENIWNAIEEDVLLPSGPYFATI